MRYIFHNMSCNQIGGQPYGAIILRHIEIRKYQAEEICKVFSIISIMMRHTQSAGMYVNAKAESGHQ